MASENQEYKHMKRNSSQFAEADRRLTLVWREIKNNLTGRQFKVIQSEQRDWLKYGRDHYARAYMKDGYTRVEAYTMATNDRVSALRERSRELSHHHHHKKRR